MSSTTWGGESVGVGGAERPEGSDIGREIKRRSRPNKVEERAHGVGSLGVHVSPHSYDICLPLERFSSARSPEESRLQELEQLLARSRASDAFKADVRNYSLRGEAPAIRIQGFVPRVKILRLLKQMLAAEPDLSIDLVRVEGSSGCSDFTGVVEAHSSHGRHVFEFQWCCRWRAEQEGWTDYFGFPDQIRAAREFDWRCFRHWERTQ